MAEMKPDDGDVDQTDEDVAAVATFDGLGLQDVLVRSIHACGLDRPTAVQQKAIMPMIIGRDVIVQAQSGAGKTTAFAIAILQSVDTTVRDTQVLCLSPTRELALRIQKANRDGVVLKLGDALNVLCRVCIGGTKLSDNLNKLKCGQHIISGTPGRVLDSMKRTVLCTSNIKTLVFDNAEEILKKGFREQLYDIYSFLPPTTQVILLSETSHECILDITQKMMTHPIKVLVKWDELTLNGTRQFFVVVNHDDWKVDILCDLHDTITKSQTVIFCNSKRKVKWLTAKLRLSNFTVSAVHGNILREEMDIILTEFRLGGTRILISTDILTRGIINIQRSLLAINFDLPINGDLYMQRIGISGLPGHRNIVVINFVHNSNLWKLQEIERSYSTRIYEMPMNIAELL